MSRNEKSSKGKRVGKQIDGRSNKPVSKDKAPVKKQTPTAKPVKKEGLRLCLKLHPKDNLKNYSSFDVDLIDSIEEALINNICFARKSTTLIECIYNNSKAAAILTNSKDICLFHTFPSLQNKEIHVTTNVNELFKWIKINIDRI